MSKPDYDTTLARIAGNIASNYVNADFTNSDECIAKWSVALARAIVAEIRLASSPRTPNG